MSITKQIANHLREIHFGGNWSVSNLKDILADITWQQATQQVDDLNSIATLTYHSTYFVTSLLTVLEGKALNSKDVESFQLPKTETRQDWDQLLEKAWQNAENAADLIDQLPDSKLLEDFDDGKYGNYYRNIIGIIEHMHYHLGQIVLIKKILKQ